VKVARIARFGSSGVPAQVGCGDFELKRAVRDLFEELGRIGNGVVHRLQFRHGLPTELEIAADSNSPPFSVEGIV
jgi:hypothetical protein